MDCLAHWIVAAEAERDVRDAARNLRVWQMLLDPLGGSDEIDSVVRVLLDAGRDRKHVRVDDDVLGRKADAIEEQVVGAPRDLDASLVGISLSALVERHHDRRAAVAPHELRLAQELGLALLERDRVDHRLALDALQPRLDHVPFRGVDHDRHACDVGLGGDQVEKARHRRLGIEHRLVHVDVDHLRAVCDLLAGDSARTGDVGALADVNEERVVVDGEWLEAGEPQRTGSHAAFLLRPRESTVRS